MAQSIPSQAHSELTDPPGMQRAPLSSLGPGALPHALPRGARPLIGFLAWAGATVLTGRLRKGRDQPLFLPVLCARVCQTLCLSFLGMSVCCLSVPQSCPREAARSHCLPLALPGILRPRLHPR